MKTVEYSKNILNQ